MTLRLERETTSCPCQPARARAFASLTFPCSRPVAPTRLQGAEERSYTKPTEGMNLVPFVLLVAQKPYCLGEIFMLRPRQPSEVERFALQHRLTLRLALRAPTGRFPLRVPLRPLRTSRFKDPLDMPVTLGLEAAHRRGNPARSWLRLSRARSLCLCGNSASPRVTELAICEPADWVSRPMRCVFR